jgi:hypothetical protein
MFCSENAEKSKSVKNEWQASYQLSNDGVLKIIPVFEEKRYVPVILMNWLYVEFKRDNINEFVDELHKEILRVFFRCHKREEYKNNKYFVEDCERLRIYIHKRANQWIHVEINARR